jgi:hypothetical protein
MNFDFVTTMMEMQIFQIIPFVRTFHDNDKLLGFVTSFIKVLMLYLTSKRVRLGVLGVIMSLGYLLMFLKPYIDIGTFLEELTYLWAVLKIYCAYRPPHVPRLT